MSILLTIPSYSQSLKELLEGESKYIAEPTKDATDTVPNTAVKTSLVESDLVFKAVAPALKIIKQRWNHLWLKHHKSERRQPFEVASVDFFILFVI